MDSQGAPWLWAPFEHTHSGPAWGIWDDQGGPSWGYNFLSFILSGLKKHTGKTPDWGFLTKTLSQYLLWDFRKKKTPNPFKVRFCFIACIKLLKTTSLFSWHLVKAGPQSLLGLGPFLLKAMVCDFWELIGGCKLLYSNSLFFYFPNPSFLVVCPKICNPVKFISVI